MFLNIFFGGKTKRENCFKHSESILVATTLKFHCQRCMFLLVLYWPTRFCHFGLFCMILQCSLNGSLANIAKNNNNKSFLCNRVWKKHLFRLFPFLLFHLYFFTGYNTFLVLQTPLSCVSLLWSLFIAWRFRTVAAGSKDAACCPIQWSQSCFKNI